jgi:hypothetical protein
VSAWPGLPEAIEASIGGCDQLIGGAEESADDRQLLAVPLLVEGLSPNRSGMNGRGLRLPLPQGRVAALWLL